MTTSSKSKKLCAQRQWCLGSFSGTAQRGINTVEFALLLPILMMLLSIVVDMGRYVSRKQELISLTREAANLAARQMDSGSSTNFPNTMTQVATNAWPIDLLNDGRMYMARVYRTPTNAVIQQFHQYGNLPNAALVLTGGFGGNATLPTHVTMVTNQTYYVVEAYIDFEPVMPLTGPMFNYLWNNAKTNYLYDIAYF